MSIRFYAWTLYVDTFECFLTELPVKDGKQQTYEHRALHFVHLNIIFCVCDFYCSLCRKGSQKAPSTAGEPSSGGGDEGVTGRKEVPPELARLRSSSDGK